MRSYKKKIDEKLNLSAEVKTTFPYRTTTVKEAKTSTKQKLKIKNSGVNVVFNKKRC